MRICVGNTPANSLTPPAAGITSSFSNLALRHPWNQKVKEEPENGEEAENFNEWEEREEESQAETWPLRNQSARVAGVGFCFMGCQVPLAVPLNGK